MSSMLLDSSVVELTEKFSLRDWQSEAISEWLNSGSRGVIEAVTGAGKTRLGVAAVGYAISQGRRALVVVPTVELMNQWTRELAQWFKADELGRFGGDHREWFSSTRRIVVGVVHSVAKKNQEELGSVRDSGRLLVADEVHRYGAESWAKGLTSTYELRLGLTATYERPDDAHLDVLNPYFGGGTIYRLWYDRALKDGLIADFDIAFVSVPMSGIEKVAYDEQEEKFLNSWQKLRGYIDTNASRAQIEKQIDALAKDSTAIPACYFARQYQASRAKRRSLAAESSAKLEALSHVMKAYASKRTSLIFTLTQESAREAAKAASRPGSPARAVYSDSDNDERLMAMQAFRDGKVSSLAAPRILDEGIDVPEADLGIILATNRSRRQLVQRLGRIIRKKSDGRRAQFIILYSSHTMEDPFWRNGGDEYLQEILPFAWRVGRFELESIRELLAFMDLDLAENSVRDNAFRDVELASNDTADDEAHQLENGEELGDTESVLQANSCGVHAKNLGDRDRDDPRATERSVAANPPPLPRVHRKVKSSGSAQLIRRAIARGLLREGQPLFLRQRGAPGSRVEILANGRVVDTRFGAQATLEEVSARQLGGQLVGPRLLERWVTGSGTSLETIYLVLRGVVKVPVSRANEVRDEVTAVQVTNGSNGDRDDLRTYFSLCERALKAHRGSMESADVLAKNLDLTPEEFLRQVADARFFENPESMPGRLQAAVEARASGMTLNQCRNDGDRRALSDGAMLDYLEMNWLSLIEGSSKNVRRGSTKPNNRIPIEIRTNADMDSLMPSLDELIRVGVRMEYLTVGDELNLDIGSGNVPLRYEIKEHGLLASAIDPNAVSLLHVIVRHFGETDEPSQKLEKFAQQGGSTLSEISRLVAEERQLQAQPRKRFI